MHDRAHVAVTVMGPEERHVRTCTCVLRRVAIRRRAELWAARVGNAAIDEVATRSPADVDLDAIEERANRIVALVKSVRTIEAAIRCAENEGTKAEA